MRRPRAAGVLTLLLLGCPSPPPAAAPQVSPPPPPPTATPTPASSIAFTSAAPSAYVEVPRPRLDISLQTDRASFALPFGEWWVAAEGSAPVIVIGPLGFSAPSVSAERPLFQVQAGSFTAREAAEAERSRLAGLLGVEASAVETAGRFAVRVGVAQDRKLAEALLAQVRRQAVPDAFLTGLPRPGNGGAALVVESREGRREVRGSVELAPVDGSLVAVPDLNGSPAPALYRGHLVVRPTGRGTLHVINRVGLEDYLKGVVPGEMGPRVFDELEALKAQTIAARSYAVRHRGDFAAEGYDLCATPRCQVYGGVALEQPLTSQAVEETAGEVLLWKGQVADTLFTSTCGGRTENAPDVFPGYANVDAPYLASVACWGEDAVEVPARITPTGQDLSALSLRGRVLLASLGRTGAAASDLAVARKALRDRLGLPGLAGPGSLSAEEVYEDLAGAAALGDLRLLSEDVELRSAPASWSEKARRAYAVLQRFSVGGASTLPLARPLKVDEVAGLWAVVLVRLGDLEELDARFVSLGEGEGTLTSVTLKSAKGKGPVPVGESLALFRGGPDVFNPQEKLPLHPGDKVRAFLRDGKLVALSAPVPGASGTYERESAWVHWTRRFTGSELAAKLRERDPGRQATQVSDLKVVARGSSGRAKKVLVSTDRGPLELTGLEIRFSLALPESLFSVSVGRAGKEPVFTFYGRGWGHGVGLCQNGAFGMAVTGKGYREILARYYPGAVTGPSPVEP